MVTLGIDLTQQPALTVQSRDAGPRAHGAGNNRVFKTNRSFACACGQVTFNKGAERVVLDMPCIAVSRSRLLRLLFYDPID